VRLYADVDTIANDGLWIKQEGIPLVDGCLDLKSLGERWGMEECSVCNVLSLDLRCC
jgi:hypothetical protein